MRSLCLRLRQELLEQFFDGLQISLALELRTDFALSVDQKGQGQSHNSAIRLAQFFIAHGHRIIWLQFSIGSADQRGVVVHGDADDLQALRTVLPLPLGEARHFNLAGGTPCGPEVEQDNLPAQTAEVNLLPVQVHADKSRSRLVDEGFRS